MNAARGAAPSPWYAGGMNPRTLLAAAGVVHLAAAVLHLAWLPGLARGAAAAGVPAAHGRLLLLTTAATGVLLAAMGALAVRYAGGGRWREPGAVAFAWTGALAWTARALLELRYPVEVPLLGLTGLSPVVLAGSVGTSALFLLAGRAMRARS